jgi:hypothetical protein
LPKIKKIIVKDPNTYHSALCAVRSIVVDPKHPVKVSITEAKNIRTLAQNDHMWGVLTDISNQVEWYGQKLTKEEWKDVLTAGLKKQKVVPGIDGGFVVIGARTSKMSVKEMIDLLDLAYAFGNEHDVKWSVPASMMGQLFGAEEPWPFFFPVQT